MISGYSALLAQRSAILPNGVGLLSAIFTCEATPRAGIAASPRLQALAATFPSPALLDLNGNFLPRECIQDKIGVQLLLAAAPRAIAVL